MNFFHFLLFIQIFVLGNFDDVNGAGREIRANIKEKATRAHGHIVTGGKKLFNPNSEKNEMHQLKIWVEKVFKKTKEQLLAEFQEPNYGEPKLSPAFEANAPKNRYNNIRLVEATRVKLSGGKYIHANTVSGTGKNKIICTQGPQEAKGSDEMADESIRENTIGDFWQMIFEQKVDAIVMVTDTFEGAAKVQKCAQYWPLDGNDNAHRSFGDYTIKFESKERLADISYTNIALTKLEINTKEDVKHKSKKVNPKVSHFQWIGWPDNDSPADADAPFLLWKKLEKEKYKNVVVHCSAGIGRTGTIVAIQMGLHMMRTAQALDIPDLVKKLRRQRAGSVQKLPQYGYIYYAFLSYAKKQHENGKIKLTDVEFDGINKLIEDLSNPLEKWAKKVAEKTVDELKKEFAPNPLDISHETKVQLLNGSIINAKYVKNAGIDIFCTDGLIKEMMTTEGPNKKKIAVFWQMIVEKKIRAILMVTDKVEGGKENYVQYWPDKEHISFEGFKIQFRKKWLANIDNIVQTDLEITTPSSKEVHKVSHFHWVGWSDHGVPTNPRTLISLWNFLETMGHYSIAVHDSGSAEDGRTETIVAIQMGRNFLKTGKDLDILGLVKQLHKESAVIMQNVKYYLYIYNAFLSQAKSSADFKIDHVKIDHLMEEIKNEIVKPKEEKEIMEI